MSSWSEVSPANHTTTPPPRTSIPVAPLGRCGIGRAPWSARTRSTSTPGATATQSVPEASRTPSF